MRAALDDAWKQVDISEMAKKRLQDVVRQLPTCALRTILKEGALVDPLAW